MTFFPQSIDLILNLIEAFPQGNLEQYNIGENDDKTRYGLFMMNDDEQSRQLTEEERFEQGWWLNDDSQENGSNIHKIIFLSIFTRKSKFAEISDLFYSLTIIF